MKKYSYLITFLFCFAALAAQPTIEQSQADDQSVFGIDSAKKPVSDPIVKTIVYDTVKVEVYDTIYHENIEKVTDQTPEAIIKETNPLQKIGEIVSSRNIIWSILILLLTYYLIKLITTVLNHFAEKNIRFRNIFQRINPLVRIFGWTLAIFIVIKGIFQPPQETIFAVLASAGIAIGFASQDVLKNIFGGLMILIDRPFQVGDKIEVGEYYGEVKEIGLRSTRIVTKDDSLISIPNAEVVNKAVSNSNAGENNCQVVAEIYLPLDIDTDLVRKIATETAQTSRYIYLNKPVTVLFFNEVVQKRSYLKMRLKAYVSDLSNEFNFQSDMTEIFLKELFDRKIINKEDMI